MDQAVTRAILTPRSLADQCAANSSTPSPTPPVMWRDVVACVRRGNPSRCSILSLDEVLDVTTRMLRASGCQRCRRTPRRAASADAEAEGIRTVGLSYLPTYCDHVARGKVLGDAIPTVNAPPGDGGGRCRQRLLPSGVRKPA